MTILYIAIGVVIAAYFIRLFMHGRKERERIREWRQDREQQERLAGDAWDHEKERITEHLATHPLVRRVDLPPPPKDDDETRTWPVMPDKD